MVYVVIFIPRKFWTHYRWEAKVHGVLLLYVTTIFKSEKQFVVLQLKQKSCGINRAQQIVGGEWRSIKEQRNFSAERHAPVEAKAVSGGGVLSLCLNSLFMMRRLGHIERLSGWDCIDLSLSTYSRQTRSPTVVCLDNISLYFRPIYYVPQI